MDASHRQVLAEIEAKVLAELEDIDRLNLYVRKVRGQQVIADYDLAAYYGVTTKTLRSQATRNWRRFPKDARFRLNADESLSLCGHKEGYLPYAYTMKGVLLAAQVVSSEKAVQVHIAYVRAFCDLAEASGISAWDAVFGAKEGEITDVAGASIEGVDLARAQIANSDFDQVFPLGAALGREIPSELER